MQVLEIKKLEDYLIAKNKSYAVYGLTRNEIKNEFLLSDDDVDEYLLKRRFVYSIDESIQILIKINKNKERKENDINNTKNTKWNLRW